MADVVIDQLTKRFTNGVVAVDQVSLRIASGEFMVLVGPSGCGKSTTMRMVAGLEDATSGSIAIDGRIINDLEPKDRDIAMVFQNYALYPHMTVEENMGFSLRVRNVAREAIRKAVEEVADILELSPYLRRYPKELSGGQRQRVALGRAIVRKPKVFLFDEPLSNLDAKMRVTMRLEISNLHRRLKSTMIYVTHDQTEAMTMGDRICVMKDGLIQQIAAPLQLYRHPANVFVAGFIGLPPMNLLRGCRLDRVTMCLRGDGICIPVDDEVLRRHEALGAPVVTLGIRPEDLQPTSSTAVHAVATVEAVEPMGNETLVYFRLGSTNSVARLGAESAVSRGDTLCLICNTRNMHLFPDGEVRGAC